MIVENLRRISEHLRSERLGDSAVTVYKAADEIERLSAIVDRIPRDRLNPWHTVTINATGWHMAHPIDCVLAECQFDGLAQAEWTEPPAPFGVWRWHSFEDQHTEWELEADG